MASLPPEEKFRIPHLDAHLTGILTRPANERQWTRGDSLRPIALILHGQLAHKNQTFHPALARRLAEDGLASFRFDFRSNHESPGDWRIDDFDSDIVDLKRVAEHLEELGYRVHLIVAHSRGSITSFRFICLHHRDIPFFVNVAGRHKMDEVLSRAKSGPWAEGFAKQGFYEWKAKVAGEHVVKIIRPEDLNAFATYDVGFVERTFPASTDVLTIHGTADEAVPVRDAHSWHDILSRRSPGTHTLRLIEGGDHNLRGHNDAMAAIIGDWVQSRSLSPCAPEVEPPRARM